MDIQEQAAHEKWCPLTIGTSDLSVKCLGSKCMLWKCGRRSEMLWGNEVTGMLWWKKVTPRFHVMQIDDPHYGHCALIEKGVEWPDVGPEAAAQRTTA